MQQLPVLGIDIGSVSVSCALLGASGEVRATAHRAHRGKVREALAEVIAELGPGTVAGIAATGAAPRLLPTARSVDPLVALVAACQRLVPEAGSILVVGGERFSLVRLDAAGAYEGVKSNTSCAAGTGSFLDQQARRLGLASSRELAAAALANTGEPPRISTRCAVFARTDLVHAQQAGHTLEEICDGLCAGLARNIADTVLAGTPPRAPVVFAGGVAANEAVCRHLERLFGTPVRAHPLSPVLGAVGAALDLLGAPEAPGGPVDLSAGIESLLADERGTHRTYYEALPEAAADGRPSDGVRRFVHDGGRFSRQHPVEVEIFREPVAGPDGVPVWLGIDIGSTSTKAVLAGVDGEPVVGLYTRTLGRPVSAAQAMLEAHRPSPPRPARGGGCSARPPPARGASSSVGSSAPTSCVDEITAHARAAFELIPTWTRSSRSAGRTRSSPPCGRPGDLRPHEHGLRRGHRQLHRGAGARLGVELSEYAAGGRRARAARERPLHRLHGARHQPPPEPRLLGERDPRRVAALGARELPAEGGPRRADGVAHLLPGRHRAQPRPGRRLRAEAREAHLRLPLLPPHRRPRCGALAPRAAGAATAAAATAFRGFDAALAGEVPIRSETCDLCANHCRLRIAEVAGETVAYGFLCGRDYDTHRFVNANRSGFDLLAERRRAFAAEGMLPQSVPPRAGVCTLGLPAALGLVADLPRWRRFFADLGVPVVTSEGFDGATTMGRDVEGAEFCAPVSSLHGHASWLADRADRVFLPVRLEERARARSGADHSATTRSSVRPSSRPSSP